MCGADSFSHGMWVGDRDLEGVTLEFSGLKGQSGKEQAKHRSPEDGKRSPVEIY